MNKAELLTTLLRMQIEAVRGLDLLGAEALSLTLVIEAQAPTRTERDLLVISDVPPEDHGRVAGLFSASVAQQAAQADRTATTPKVH